MEKEGTNPEKERAYSWFPGHMRKALRQLEESLNLADIVLLVMDARIPNSSRQPDIEAMLKRKNKEMLLVLNKADLADEAETKKWLSFLQSAGLDAVSIRATAGKGAGPLADYIAKLRQKTDAKRKAKGMLPRDPRIAVAGIPNVGKSSLLNRLAGASRAKTGAKPGITRGNQWVSVPGLWQVLDSPGILYPRIEGEFPLTSLAASSCISIETIPLERVGGLFLQRLIKLDRAKRLFKNNPDWAAQFKDDEKPENLLSSFAIAKNFMINANEPDTVRAARFILKSFAQGDLGRATLETLELCGFHADTV